MICLNCNHPDHGTWTCGVLVDVPGSMGGKLACQCSMSVPVSLFMAAWFFGEWWREWARR